MIPTLQQKLEDKEINILVYVADGLLLSWPLQVNLLIKEYLDY